MGFSDFSIKTMEAQLQRPDLSKEDKEALKLKIEQAKVDAQNAQIQQALSKGVKPSKPVYGK